MFLGLGEYKIFHCNKLSMYHIFRMIRDLGKLKEPFCFDFLHSPDPNLVEELCAWVRKPQSQPSLQLKMIT